MITEPLASHHNRNSFDCGEPVMNEFLQKTARQYAERDIGVTHVVVEEDGSSRILGYVTLAIKTVNREELPNKGLPRGDFGVALLVKLAVDKDYQQHGLGKRLLFFALYKAQQMAETFGLVGVAVDLLNEDVRPFYETRGFKPLLDDTPRLYLSMKEIRKMGLTLSASGAE